MNTKLISALAATALLSAAPAFAAPVTLDFESVTTGASVGNLYIGYGISFGGDVLGVVNDEFTQFISNAPSGVGAMSAVGPANALNAVGPGGGLQGAVSFFYSAADVSTVTVWSGLNGTGTALASFDLTANAGGCSIDTPYCMWTAATITFAGFAKSVTFDPSGFTAFDNVQVDAVPLPAAGWLLISALTGFGAWRRKRALAA